MAAISLTLSQHGLDHGILLAHGIQSRLVLEPHHGAVAALPPGNSAVHICTRAFVQGDLGHVLAHNIPELLMVILEEDDGTSGLDIVCGRTPSYGELDNFLDSGIGDGGFFGEGVDGPTGLGKVEKSLYLAHFGCVCGREQVRCERGR